MDEQELPTTRTAYLLWLPSLIGVAGLQRFYLGKIGTGLLFLFTGGIFGIGTIYDLLTLPRQVEETRLRKKYRWALGFVDDTAGGNRLPRTEEKRESIEHVILRVAKKNHGIAAPAEVALEADISADNAKNYLEKLVEKGHADMRVRSSGRIAYVFPDFLDEYTDKDFEDI
jgi:predicted transcriptional regulator